MPNGAGSAVADPAEGLLREYYEARFQGFGLKPQGGWLEEGRRILWAEESSWVLNRTQLPAQRASVFTLSLIFKLLAGRQNVAVAAQQIRVDDADLMEVKNITPENLGLVPSVKRLRAGLPVVLEGKHWGYLEDFLVNWDPGKPMQLIGLRWFEDKPWDGGTLDEIAEGLRC